MTYFPTKRWKQHLNFPPTASDVSLKSSSSKKKKYFYALKMFLFTALSADGPSCRFMHIWDPELETNISEEDTGSNEESVKVWNSDIKQLDYTMSLLTISPQKEICIFIVIMLHIRLFDRSAWERHPDGIKIVPAQLHKSDCRTFTFNWITCSTMTTRDNTKCLINRRSVTNRHFK